MSSHQAQAITRLYQDWATRLMQDPPMDLPATRDMFEGWHLLADEAPGVAFEAVDAGGVPALWCRPEGAVRDRVVIYLHGGGYVVGSMHSHRKVAAHIARAVGCAALVVDYRRAPEHPHPAPCEDSVSVFRWLLTQGIAPGAIALAGDSAGGGLATATAIALRDAGGPLPAAIMAASPFFDMEVIGETLTTRASVDVLVQQPVLKGMVSMFLGDADPTDPLANPLHADLRGLPPVMIVTGDHEVLLDDSLRFVALAKAADVNVTLTIVPEMQHVFVLGAGRVPEADGAVADLAAWVRPLLNL